MGWRRAVPGWGGSPGVLGDILGMAGARAGSGLVPW